MAATPPEAEATSANTANSFILMTLLTSAEQRSGSDGSYHSRGAGEGTLFASPTVNSLAVAASAARLHSKTVNRGGFEFVTASPRPGGINPPLRSGDTH